MVGGPAFSWHDAYLLAVNAQPGGPLATAIDPRAAWTRADYWLQSIEYSLRWLVWAKTKDGQKGRRRPKPVAAPKAPRKRAPDPKLAAMTTDELDAFLSRPRTPITSTT